MLDVDVLLLRGCHVVGSKGNVHFLGSRACYGIDKSGKELT